MINTFHKEHSKKLTTTFPHFDSALPIARPTVKPKLNYSKSKSTTSAKQAQKTWFWIFSPHKRYFTSLLAYIYKKYWGCIVESGASKCCQVLSQAFGVQIQKNHQYISTYLEQPLKQSFIFIKIAITMVYVQKNRRCGSKYLKTNL